MDNEKLRVKNRGEVTVNAIFLIQSMRIIVGRKIESYRAEWAQGDKRAKERGNPCGLPLFSDDM